MEFTDKRDIGLKRDTDHVSRLIRLLAFGLMILGAAFVALDRCHLLPPLPAAAVAHAPLSPSKDHIPVRTSFRTGKFIGGERTKLSEHKGLPGPNTRLGLISPSRAAGCDCTNPGLT
jgi:hypothetical protein